MFSVIGLHLPGFSYSQRFEKGFSQIPEDAFADSAIEFLLLYASVIPLKTYVKNLRENSRNLRETPPFIKAFKLKWKQHRNQQQTDQ